MIVFGIFPPSCPEKVSLDDKLPRVRGFIGGY